MAAKRILYAAHGSRYLQFIALTLQAPQPSALGQPHQNGWLAGVLLLLLAINKNHARIGFVPCTVLSLVHPYTEAHKSVGIGRIARGSSFR